MIEMEEVNQFPNFLLSMRFSWYVHTTKVSERYRIQQSIPWISLELVNEKISQKITKISQCKAKKSKKKQIR